MKKLIYLLIFVSSLVLLTGCAGEDAEVYEKPDNIISFSHIDGYGYIAERDAYILFEYKMRDYVKYQLAYVACTCRSAEVNFWKVAYVEIGTNDHEIRTISFDQDGTDKYTAGFWGDSDPIPPYGEVDTPLSQWITKDDFDEHFIPWLIGKTAEDLEGINVFTNAPYAGGVTNEKVIDETNLIDMFTGASVTSNNMIRAMQALLDYHNAKYAK